MIIIADSNIFMSALINSSGHKALILAERKKVTDISLLLQKNWVNISIINKTSNLLISVEETLLSYKGYAICFVASSAFHWYIV